MTVETVREPLLVLDQNLRVESANRSFYLTFRVTAADTVGRFIYELGDRQWDIPRLRELLQDILPQRTTIEDYQVEHDFESLGPRIILLNARHMSDYGRTKPRILLAIEDVTERRRAEAVLRAGMDELSRFNDVAVGRELRMVELKKGVNALCERQGEAARYPLDFEREGQDVGRGEEGERS